MKLYGNDEVRGTQVTLKTSHPNHYRIERSRESDDQAVKSFGQLLSDSFGKVNNLQLESDDLTRKLITEPESVSIHNVMLAAQKAELSLSLAKSVTDRMIRAYQEIVNLR